MCCDQPGWRPGAPPRARGRGGVPPLSAARTPKWPLLGHRRYRRHAGAQPLCPPLRSRQRPRRRRQMERCRNRRARRSAGPDRPPPAPVARCRRDRRGPRLSRPAVPSKAPISRPGTHVRRPARRKRRAACSLSDVRSPALRPRPICALAASPPGSTGRPCASTPLSGTARAKRIRAKPGRRCWPRSPIPPAPSPASSAAGSTAPARQRRRSPIRAAPSAISSAMASASAAATDIVAAGEGVETMLALASVLPSLPLIAALSANHLAALAFAPSWRRLYVARDNDAAGRHAAAPAARTRAGRRYRNPRARAGARGLQRRSLRPRPRRAPRASRSPARPRRSRPLRRRSGRPVIAVPSPRDRAGRRKPVRAGGGQAFSRKQRAAPRPSRAAICRSRRAARNGAALIPGAMAAASHFPPPARKSGPALHRETKCSDVRHPPRCFGPCGCAASPSPAWDRREGRDGRGRILRQKGTRHDTPRQPPPLPRQRSRHRTPRRLADRVPARRAGAVRLPAGTGRARSAADARIPTPSRAISAQSPKRSKPCSPAPASRTMPTICSGPS